MWGLANKMAENLHYSQQVSLQMAMCQQATKWSNRQIVAAAAAAAATTRYWQSTSVSAAMTTNIIVIHFSTRTELNSPHKCNTTAIQLQYKNSCIAVVLHLCGPLQYSSAIQVFYNLQKTCRLLAAVMWKKLILQLYCACADCCNTTKFLCYVITVAL